MSNEVDKDDKEISPRRTSIDGWATMSFEDEYISRRELRIFFGASETSDSGTSHVGSDHHTRASLRF